MNHRIGNLRQWYDLGLGLVCCGRKPNLKARLALEDLLSFHLPSFSSHLVAPPWLSKCLYHISALRSSTLQTVTVSTTVNSNHPQTQYQGRTWKRARYDSGCLKMTRSGSVMISYDCSGDDNWLFVHWCETGRLSCTGVILSKAGWKFHCYYDVIKFWTRPLRSPENEWVKHAISRIIQRPLGQPPYQ